MSYEESLLDLLLKPRAYSRNRLPTVELSVSPQVEASLIVRLLSDRSDPVIILLAGSDSLAEANPEVPGNTSDALAR